MKNISELLDLEIPDKELVELILEHPLEDLLDNWDIFSNHHRIAIFRLSDLDTKVNLMTNLPPAAQEDILTFLSVQNTKSLFGEMEPDDVVDFIQAVNAEVRKSVWDSLSDESKKESLFLLRFDEDDAAGLMTPRYLEINVHATCDQALKFIRSHAEEVETIYYAYVLDEFKRLVGILSLKELILTSGDKPVREIMTTNIISVEEDRDQEDVAKVLETYNLLAVPVVNKQNILLGIVTFDDVIDVIREEQTEDVYKMGAMGGSLMPYLNSSILGLIRKRLPWLLVMLVVGAITTNVLDHYTGLFLSAAFLINFIPVITQTGGNTGSQSATLMIRGLATGEIHFRDIWKVLSRELLVGLVMGLIIGLVMVFRSYYLPPAGIEWLQAITIGLSMVFVVTFSTLIGSTAPLLIHKLGFDPAVMSGPLMSTVIDVAGLTIYFEFASRILL
jgi:magnesium transporter